MQRPNSYRAAAHTPEKRDSILSHFLSIRVVLVTITILTVVTMGVILVYLSVAAQHSIVNDLSTRIQKDVSMQISERLNHIFQYVEDELYSGLIYFSTNVTEVPFGTNPINALPKLTDYLWGIVRKRPMGMQVEYDFPDGRFYGMESYNKEAVMFWADNDNGTLFDTIWKLELNQIIEDVDLSEPIEQFHFPEGTSTLTSYRDEKDCLLPATWYNIYLYILNGQRFYVMYCVLAVCDPQGKYAGFLGASVSLGSLEGFLGEITAEVQGKIFIMNSDNYLISTSTNSEIFDIIDDAPEQISIFNTTERWIQDVVKVLNGNYGVQERTVKINGTTYFLTINQYHNFTGIDWYIVKLLEREQFLGNTEGYFLKSVLAAVAVTVAALAVVIFVSWAMTNPLFILASDLQKMSRLDLESSEMQTPRILEVGKLYRSVATMYVALQSFKKFVPIQVISKIMKSEKEVTAELVPSQVTIVFQDIEGFTSLSEKMDPMSLAKLTSEYMETMTEIICKHGGTIDKYIGDCIMSLFNAPDELIGHQLAAAKSAAECMQALAVKNVQWRAQYGIEMNCRIGINSGEVLIGNMGGNNRMNYTAFGDNVNVAARLEGVNKYFGTRIIVSKSVASTFPEGVLAIRKLSKVRVSGKSLPTSIYEVRGDATQETMQLFAFYKHALKAFKSRDFAGASEKINATRSMFPNDKASRLLQERITTAISEGVPDGWTYVEDLLKL